MTWDTATTIGRLTRYRVSIHDLRRDGQFLTLDLALTCLSRPCAPAVELAQPIPGDPSASRGTASAISLFDPHTGLQYGVVRDQRNRAYASVLPATMAPGRTIQVWVNYPAASPQVASLDVVIGNGGSWVDRVPIASSGGAPAPATWGGSVTRARAAPFASMGRSQSLRLIRPVLSVESASGNSSGTDQQTGGDEILTLSSDVLFGAGRAVLTPEARTIIKALAPRIAQRARGEVTVTGYTDAIGSQALSPALSRRQAAAVAAALRTLTPTHHARYAVHGLGPNDPVAPNVTAGGGDDPAGRRLNRRITIFFAVRRSFRPSPPPPVSSPSVPSAGGPSVSYRYLTAGAGGATESERYRVGHARLVRTGRYVLLSLRVTCVQPGRTGSCSSSEAFAAGTGAQAVPPEPEAAGTSPGAARDSPSAISLLDPASGTQYVASRDASNVPLGTTLNAPIPAGESLSIWECFPAPAAGTRALDVILPGGRAAIYSVRVRAPRGITAWP
jgi:OOP family OmpA-OmpF porin